MPRVKRGKMHLKRRKGVLSKAKGFKSGRKKLIKRAQTAVTKAGAHAYRDRRVKKRNARRLWQVRLNAALRALDWNYSGFIGALKKANSELDRKVLSEMARKEPEMFKKLVNLLKK